MIKHYDRVRKQLIYLGKQADEDYWDSHWRADNFQSLVKASLKANKYFVNYTQKYLPPGSRVLEGGCGRGDKVYALQKSGFDTHGVDFAPETVGNINRFAPELKVSLGDVRQLDFEDSFFDGYWSLGVIEHFYNGFTPIQNEIRRVLKKGGYLFLTTPAMSWMRRLKAILNCYPQYIETEETREQFYQFALNSDYVVDQFQSQGFSLVQLGINGALE